MVKVGLFRDYTASKPMKTKKFKKEYFLKSSKSVPYSVGFQTMPNQDLQPMLCHTESSILHTFIEFLNIALCVDRNSITK